MTAYSSETAKQELRELTDILSAWEVNRASDSAMIHLLRSKEYRAAAELADSLVYGVQEARQRVELKVGSMAVQGYYFPNSIVDPHRMHATPLPPKFKLPVDRTNKIFNHRYNQHELFIGNRSLYVDLGTIAATLQRNGELSLVACPLPE